MEQHEDVAFDGAETTGEAVAATGGDEAAGAGAEQRTPRRRGGGLRALLGGLVKPAVPVARGDAEREAAEEIQMAATPAMERLVFAVPGAATPEDALARIEQSLPAREVASEPPPAEHLPGAEVAHTLALYQVRRHLKSYRFPTSHEQELARRLNVRSGSPAGAGGPARHN